MRLNEQEKNSFEAIWQLVRFAKLKITATTLKNVLLQSNDNNNIATISDILNEFNVPNMVARLSPYQLNEIPLPAIAFFEDNGGTFATITKIEENKIEWLHNKLGIIKESIADFSNKWSGITLMVEPNEQSGEQNYSQIRRTELLESFRMPFAILGIITLLGITIFNTTSQIPLLNNWPYYGLLATKAIGTILSIMLVWYSIDGNNSFLKAVCQINVKTNCSNILNSKAAKIFGWLSWSEIGLFYFVGNFLALLLIGSEAIKPLLLLGVFALPYTFWSIYYQGLVAKEWCPICLAVQAVIVIEFVIFLKSDSISLSLENIPWATIFQSFSIIPILWVAIKKPLQKSMRTDSLYNEFQKMKFDPEYVQSFMSKQRILPPVFEGMKVVELGDPNTENELILVLSPSCASCKQTYWAAKKLIETNSSINCKIIFAASSATNDSAGIVSRLILSQGNNIEMAESLEKWFSDYTKNIKKWTTKNKTIFETEDGGNQMSLHLRWLNLAGVDEAPVTFLNKTEIPKQYLSFELGKLLSISNSIGFANQV